MDYNVVVSMDAEADLDRHIRYLLFIKQSEQAAKNVLDDYDETIENLSGIAGSLKYCENSKLKEHGYKKIHFRRHRYFMLFRLEDNKVIIDRIFHELEDFENKIK